jgi:cobalt-zinc-cadmium efflux system protein
LTVHTHATSTGRVRWVLLLTSVFLVVEFVGGLLSNSLALLSDAGHMLSDVGALTLTWLALRHMRRPPDSRRSYGYRRLEIVSALANGALLLGVVVAVSIEGYRRLGSPPDVRGDLMLLVAVLGLVVNLIGIALLHAESRGSLGIRGAFLHIVGDALGSVGAIVAAVVIRTTGWMMIDPLVSFGIAVLILISAGHLIRESLHILMEGVPRHIHLPDVEESLRAVDGVTDLHDLHVWRIGSDFDTLTVHLVLEQEAEGRDIRDLVRRIVHRNFGITHCTIEVETPGEKVREQCGNEAEAGRAGT